MGRVRRSGVVLVVLLLALGACASGGKSASKASEALAPDGAPSAAAGGSGSRAATTGSSGAAASPAPNATGATPVLTPGSDVVYTGTLDVRVGDVEVASRGALAKVTTAGGYLFSQRSTATSGAPSATLVFKLPPTAFLDVLTQLATLGTEVGRNVQADDVTAQLVDLDARLKAAQTSADRMRELLAHSANVTELVSVEGELAKREAAVEQIKGQLRVIESQVAAATLTLTIGEKLKETKPSPSGNIPSVIDGFRGGGVALLNTLQVILLVLSALLPWLPIVLLGWFVFVRVRRLVRRRLAPHPRTKEPVD